jgi:hypothetical protein
VEYLASLKTIAESAPATSSLRALRVAR